MFEGVADFGVQMLDWIENDDDRLMELMTGYQAGIAAAAAWRMHVLLWSKERVADWLRSVNLIGGDQWVAHRMGYISSVQRGMHIWSYWRGKPIVQQIWSNIAPESHRDFYLFLYGRLHSPQSIGLFSA